jgi:hypothetical protein
MLQSLLIGRKQIIFAKKKKIEVNKMIEEIILNNHNPEKENSTEPKRAIFAHIHSNSGWIFHLADLGYMLDGMTLAGTFKSNYKILEPYDKSRPIRLNTILPNYYQIFDAIIDLHSSSNQEEQILFDMAVNMSEQYVESKFTREIIASDRLTTQERKDLDSLKKLGMRVYKFEIASMDTFRKAMNAMNYGHSKYVMY